MASETYARLKPERQISFRRLGLDDVENMVRWLREPQVARWYWDSNRKTEDELREKWQKRASGEDDEPTDRYIIVVDGQDIGEIQVYDYASFPEYAEPIGIPNAAGVDLLIGEPGWRNRGVGTAAIRKFIRELVFTRIGIEVCTIDPEPENLRAIRSYQKAGFRYVKTFHSDEDDVDVYLMRMDEPPVD